VSGQSEPDGEVCRGDSRAQGSAEAVHKLIVKDDQIRAQGRDLPGRFPGGS
jgi:hypothetical protein